MFTVCPKCALTLAVVAADLRAGQGYVRCGRCANVFNALVGLTEESGTRATVHPPTVKQERRREDREPVTGPLQSLPRVALVPEAPAPKPALMQSAPPKAAPPPPPAAAPAPARRAEVELEVDEFRGTGTFETIVLEGDTFLQTEEQVDEEEVNIELADVSRRIEAARDAGHLAPIDRVPIEIEVEEEETEAETETEAEAEVQIEVEEEEEEEEEEAEEEPLEPEEDVIEDLRPARARPSGLGIAAILGLILLLASQGIYHWRNDLATYTDWYGPLQRLAAATGVPLRPNWDLGAYELHQLGASSDSTDPRAVKVRLSLANRGVHSQALPLLRLSLLDRYGTVVSRGDLQPSEYLPAALQGQRFIASEQRIDTEVSVVDSTQQVSSFELDVCVPAAAGGVRCIGDAPVLSGRK